MVVTMVKVASGRTGSCSRDGGAFLWEQSHQRASIPTEKKN